MTEAQTPHTPPPTESTEPAGSAPAPASEGAAPGGAGAGAPAVDFAALGGNALRILKDPAESLGALHRPGQMALVQGLILGVGSAVLIPLIQFLALKIKIGRWYQPAFGDILERCLGGVAFVAAGVAVGYIMRNALAKGGRADWRDDVYLFGSPMLYVLAGALVAAVFLIIGGSFFSVLAGVVGLVALVSFAFAYQAGLARVAKLDPHRSICVALTAIAVALIVGMMLKFPIAGTQWGGAGAMYFSPPSADESMEGVRDFMKDIEDLQRRAGGGVR